MGDIRTPLPVKLITSIFAAEPPLFATVKRELVEAFGPIDYQSPRLPFNQTDYYRQEFVPDLQREIIAFRPLIDPARIAEIKRYSNGLEVEYAREDGSRRVNLDPGYLEQGKLVLVTTKNYAHRIYLGQGIYAEVTLIYRNHNFQPLPWTYPDYASDAYTAMLSEIRDVYGKQLRKLRRKADAPTLRSG